MSHTPICCRKAIIYAVALLISCTLNSCSSSENPEIESPSNEFEQQISTEIKDDGTHENLIPEENLGCGGDMDEFPCPDCSALGYETCNKCDGRGVIHCPSCDGDGWDPNGRACLNCQKSGLIECEIHQTCGMCGGVKYGIYISCETCEGTGYITLKDGQQITCGGGNDLNMKSIFASLYMSLFDIRANTSLTGQTYCNGTGKVFRLTE